MRCLPVGNSSHICQVRAHQSHVEAPNSQSCAGGGRCGNWLRGWRRHHVGAHGRRADVAGGRCARCCLWRLRRSSGPLGRAAPWGGLGGHSRALRGPCDCLGKCDQIRRAALPGQERVRLPLGRALHGWHARPCHALACGLGPCEVLDGVCHGPQKLFRQLDVTRWSKSQMAVRAIIPCSSAVGMASNAMAWHLNPGQCPW